MLFPLVGTQTLSQSRAVSRNPKPAEISTEIINRVQEKPVNKLMIKQEVDQFEHQQKIPSHKTLNALPRVIAALWNFVKDCHFPATPSNW
jgi:hypothetical protein